MRRILSAVVLPLLGACAAPKTDPDIVVPYEDQVKEALDEGGNEQGQVIRRTYQNVRRYDELRIEMQEQPMSAMRRTIGRSVDDNYATFKQYALDKNSATLRNWAVACLGFAIEKRVDARKLLESMLTDETLPPWLLANACQALAVMRDKETDLTYVIPLVGHGNTEVRACAGTTIKEIWSVTPTPRDLTPQYYAAIDRLVALLHDDATTRGRRAAVWAFANLHHPAVLEHLIAALNDSDAEVQVGGLRGLEMLGDARAIEPLCAYLDGSPQEGPASFAVRALQQIAVQNGFAETRTELESLGTSGKAWRKWFRAQRMGGPPKSAPKSPGSS
ncbi:MAG TPA: HEAT repeat domain-containing protein [Planctomycetota bacterium]|nr:HEAT repeat domain-containing protein [Planctomycetota bacterium]